MASTFTVERSTTIPAPVDRVHDLINNFREWRKWSPWEEVDPDLNRTYSGSDAGVGAVYEWSGNRQAGQGRMEITTDEPDKVELNLDFLKPFKSSNVTTFTLAPEGDGTRVTWTMVGPRPLVMRLLGPLMNMDKVVGGDFEKGLAKLSTAATANE